MKISLFLKRLFMAVLVLSITGSFVGMSYAYFDTLQETTNENITLGEWRDNCANTITTAQQFYDFATSSTSNSSDYYCLGNDIDFSGFTWNHTSSFDTNLFQGTLDGQGHTLSNITLSSNDTLTKYMSLFSRMNGATIKNVNINSYTMGITNSFFNNSSIDSAIFASQVTGTNNTFENITITNSQVISNTLNGAGGLVAQVEANTNLTIKNVKTTNLTVLSSSKRAGGLISRIIKGTGVITVEDVDFHGYIASGNSTSNTGAITGTVQDATLNISRVVIEYIAEGTVNLADTSITYRSNKYVGGFIGNTQAGSIMNINDAFFTGTLYNVYNNVGSVIGRRKATPTMNNVYYSNTLFVNSYTPTTSTGVVNGTVVNATSMPSNTWWNSFKVNFDNANNLWTQDQSGRLTLIR